MGFDFGTVKTNNKQASLVKAAQHAVDTVLEEKYLNYLKSYKKKDYRKSTDFLEAIEYYDEFMNTNDPELKSRYFKYNLFHFSIVDKMVNIIINPDNDLFENIGSIDFIANSPLPIRKIEGIINDGEENKYRIHSLPYFDITRKCKNITDIKQWPSIDAHVINLEVMPKTVNIFDNLMKMVIEHNGVLNIPHLHDNNMYVQTKEHQIMYGDEIMAKKNSYILLEDYLVSDNFNNMGDDIFNRVKANTNTKYGRWYQSNSRRY